MNRLFSRAAARRSRPWFRAAGMFFLAVFLAVSCSNRGCQGCGGCARPEAEPTKGTKPGGAESGGGCAGPSGRRTTSSPAPPRPGGAGGSPQSPFSPFQPVRILDSNKEVYEAKEEERRLARERRERIIGQGEGSNLPAAPENLTVRPDPAGARAILQWHDAAENELAYQVDRAGSDGLYRLAYILPAGTQGVNDGPLPPGDYSYRVRAVGLYGASAYGGPVSLRLSGTSSLPPAPASLTATAGPGLKVNLVWTDQADNEVYFRIERAEGSGNFYSLGQLGPDFTRFEDLQVQAGVRYLYRVIAGNTAGEAASNVAEVTVTKEHKPPAAPANLRIQTLGPGTVSLEWEDRSDNEDRFLVEEKIRDRDQFFAITQAPADTPKVLLGQLSPGRPFTLRVRAENAAGISEPSNEVTTTAESPALAAFLMTWSPDGQIIISQPGDPLAPRLQVKSARREGGVVTAEIAVQNPDPDSRLANVYAVVEYAESPGLVLDGCDRGPAGCSVDEGIGANPVGYQYVEDGYVGQALLGGEMEFYPTRNLRFALREIWPACGEVSVTWKIRGLFTPTLVAVVIYGDRRPADFTRDPRYSPDLSLWRVEPYTIGVSDNLHEPGSRENPSARPLHFLKTGDVFAVNFSVEAGDWLERQPQMGRAENDPRAFYFYYHTLAFALTYDPAVIRPIARPVIMAWGDVLRPGLRDQMWPDFALDDGWDATAAYFYPFPAEGLLQAVFFSPPFTIETDSTGKKICGHCGQEGFVTPAGLLEGPDSGPEASLGLIYFEVIGAAGQGTPLRLVPKPETYIELMNTSGTITLFTDDVSPDPRVELNELLPPTTQLPGDYQVQSSYVCVE